MPLVHTEGNCDRLINAMFHFNKSILFERKKSVSVCPEVSLDKHSTKQKCLYVIYRDVKRLTTESEQNKDLKSFCQEGKPCGFLLDVVNSLEKTSTPFLRGGLYGQFCRNLALAQIRNEILDGSYANGNNFEAGERISITYPLLDL